MSDDVESALPRRQRFAGITDVLRRVARVEELSIAVVLVAMVLGVGAFHSQFLSVFSLSNIGQQAAFFGVIALGMVFLLAMRDIDLSVGGNYALCIMVGARLMSHGWDPWVASAVAIAVGMALAALNAVIATGLGISLIIVTLGTLSAYHGLTLILSPGGNLVSLDHTSSSFFHVFGRSYASVPAADWAFAAMTVILTVVFRRTRFGFAVRAVGSNERAARLSGYSIGLIRLRAELLVGALCGLSGMLTLAFLQTADPNTGANFEIQTIAAAVIGGTGLAGGSGTVPGACLGALIISVIGAGLVQFNLSPNWGLFVTGSVIVAAVSLDALVRRRQRSVSQS